MPSILTHPAVPLALGLGLGGALVPRRVLLAGVVLSVLPDLDVVAFALGIAYESVLGHRGFTHSPCFAASMAALVTGAMRAPGSRPGRVFAFLFVAGASHGVLDALTNGGLGIAFLWPFGAERYFLPWPVIEVSPIGVARFLSARGLQVLVSECLWVWLPSLLLLALLAAARRRYLGPRRPGV